jgi:F1F0 ATPase subunit 2
MIEALRIGCAMVGGIALAAFFFVGLWWTVRRGVVSRQPAVWFLCSMLLRTLVVMAGFYYLSRGDWRNIAGSLAGFVLARIVITRAVSALPQPKASLQLGGVA